MSVRSFPLYDQCNFPAPYDWYTTVYNTRYLQQAAHMNIMCIIAHYCHLHSIQINYTYNVSTQMSSILNDLIPHDLKQIISNYVSMCLS